MTGHPKISVIMSVFNGEKYLREAIDSILSQTFTDFEFIIVNDGSTDNSLSIIKGYSDRRIRLIDNEQNIGLTKSLNKVIKQARGEYIARQDADDISLPNRFEEQVRHFDQHPEVALLGTSAYRIDEQGRITGRVKVKEKPGEDLLKRNQFNHGSTMFKRQVVIRLAGYNELFKYCQDYELWLRIAKYYEVRNLPQILYKLRFHQENIRSLKAEESVLYHLLAIRMIRDNLDNQLRQLIKDKGILSLYPYLTKGERVYFHTIVGDANMHRNNISAAKQDYQKVFMLAPLNIRNNINFALSYLGKGTWSIARRVYQILSYFAFPH